MTVTLRYPIGAVGGDYLRSGIGLLLTGAPLLLLDVHPVLVWPVAAMAILFALFLVQTLDRQATRIVVRSDGLSISGLRQRHIAWSALARISLAFYSTRRDGNGGWMQLRVLSLDGTSVAIESTLDGFDEVVEKTVREAVSRRLALDATTRDNLAALGMSVPSEPVIGEGERS